MAKRSGPRTASDTSLTSPSPARALIAQLHTCLDSEAEPEPHLRTLARQLLTRSGGVVVSSTMALRTAITAFRASGDFDDDSPELALLEAVFRLSEDRQVPPRQVMTVLAGPTEATFALAHRKSD